MSTKILGTGFKFTALIIITDHTIIIIAINTGTKRVVKIIFNKQTLYSMNLFDSYEAVWPRGQGAGIEIGSPTLTTSWICSR